MKYEEEKRIGGTCAFFDVDETLISVKSMLSFQTFWYDRMGDELGRARYERDLRQHSHSGASREFLNRLYYQHFSGRDPERVKAMGQEWFEHQRHLAAPFYHPRPLAELQMHQRQGREIVLVSGSFPALLEPIARELGVPHILSARLVVREGLYTGEVLSPQTIGSGKAEAIGEFLSERQCNPERCYAYGDDISDFPMLRAVGCPTVVNGARELEARARAMGWRVMAPM
ncbi:HAD family hydrolase [Marinimicrobium locisalis]|uniref:HAD family hydrolase n=1 Tax=Marinimicrobium locisalis TaxID=546022 RepID=UPI0032219391